MSHEGIKEGKHAVIKKLYVFYDYEAEKVRNPTEKS